MPIILAACLCSSKTICSHKPRCFEADLPSAGKASHQPQRTVGHTRKQRLQCGCSGICGQRDATQARTDKRYLACPALSCRPAVAVAARWTLQRCLSRSEEHTSELQ